MYTPTLLLFLLLQATAAQTQVEKPSALREINLPAARAQAEVRTLHANEEKPDLGQTIPANLSLPKQASYIEPPSPNS